MWALRVDEKVRKTPKRGAWATARCWKGICGAGGTLGVEEEELLLKPVEEYIFGAAIGLG